MILAASNMREISTAFIDELALSAARDASEPGASEADIAARAFLIRAFLFGWLEWPSRALH